MTRIYRSLRRVFKALQCAEFFMAKVAVTLEAVMFCIVW